jgi:hypothetical protein
VRAVGVAVIVNPFAGRSVEDLRQLFEAGAMLGERLMPDLVRLLDGAAVSYGKGALVGVDGEMEHGGACVHPMLGKPMRTAIGGGKAVISSNVKVATPGSTLVVPLGHTDDPWSFPHFDTITVSVADACARTRSWSSSRSQTVDGYETDAGPSRSGDLLAGGAGALRDTTGINDTRGGGHDRRRGGGSTLLWRSADNTAD